ncbi:MAG: PorT family protein [Candidatus Krumholzibacteria bacterium]|nr:PorT family protein [Candidatus Krumholzibacteria bacterium]
MKKSVIVVSLAVMIFAAGSVQALPFTSFGIKGGLEFTNQSFDGPYDPDPNGRVGLHIGIFGEWLDLPMFSLLTEVAYVQRGMKNDVLDIGDDSMIEKDNRIDYLSISVLPKYKISLIAASIYIAAGPRIDYKLRVADDTIWAEDEAEDYLKDVNIGGDIALGIDFNRFSGEFRYSRDFTSCFDNEGLEGAEPVDVINSSFGFLFGISF